jgi:hypothetical protein
MPNKTPLARSRSSTKAMSQFIYEKQKVNYCAGMLAVPPNYLSKCVKTIPGQSAHDLLSETIFWKQRFC